MTKVTMNLAVKLDPHQLADRSDALAKSVIERNQIAEEKKDAMADFTTQLKMKDTIINHLSNVVDSGEEEQPVQCEWVLNAPRRGMKQLIRLDTDDVVDELDMTDYDKQAFADSMQLRIPGLEVEMR